MVNSEHFGEEAAPHQDISKVLHHEDSNDEFTSEHLLSEGLFTLKNNLSNLDFGFQFKTQAKPYGEQERTLGAESRDPAEKPLYRGGNRDT
jgi:hypothetical protein